jgi:hypothetical protein
MCTGAWEKNGNMPLWHVAYSHFRQGREPRSITISKTGVGVFRGGRRKLLFPSFFQTGLSIFLRVQILSFGDFDWFKKMASQ